MKTWKCEVIRKQRWTFTGIEAETKDEAKDKADVMALHDIPDDDWAFDTTAEEE